MNDLFIQNGCVERPDLSMFIEEADSTCYAYLVQNSQIIAHVWLYEEISVGQKITIAPFQLTEHDTSVMWACFDTDKNQFQAGIFAGEVLIAVLREGSDVGWNRHTDQPSRLSKPLKELGL